MEAHFVTATFARGQGSRLQQEQRQPVEAVTTRIAHVHAGPLTDLSEKVTRSACHLPSLRETPTEGSPSGLTYSIVWNTLTPALTQREREFTRIHFVLHSCFLHTMLVSTRHEEERVGP